jgi:uncharacterized cysteine cluster protein YcgN (CxxCxxCC family)
MTLKKYYFDKGIELCLTCKFIDEYSLNVMGDRKVPHGYDGTSECCLFNLNEEETSENRWYISPLWKPCSKYEKCTEQQADYLEIFDTETQSIIPNLNNISKINNE